MSKIANLSELRRTQELRDSVAETSLSVSDFILPYFVVEGNQKKSPISSMQGLYHFSVDQLLFEVEDAIQNDIQAILLFGLASKKDDVGASSYAKNAPLQQAVKAIKNHFPGLTLYTDVCLCAFTTHGHCGILDQNTQLINHEKSAETLAKIALSHAEAGADYVAPSAMVDNQVFAIRESLNQNDFQGTKILSYSAKYASQFYGPFRDALDSTPAFGDRKTYQMDPRNGKEALLEIETNIEQGADIVMVKPALSYLDVIARAKDKFQFPLAAYNVSGEYNMIKHASNGNLTTEKALALEVLHSIKRAGADLIISYFGKQIKGWLEQKYE